jgi:hypothetical protein
MQQRKKTVKKEREEGKSLQLSTARCSLKPTFHESNERKCTARDGGG